MNRAPTNRIDRANRFGKNEIHAASQNRPQRNHQESACVVVECPDLVVLVSAHPFT